MTLSTKSFKSKLLIRFVRITGFQKGALLLELGRSLKFFGYNVLKRFIHNLTEKKSN